MNKRIKALIKLSNSLHSIYKKKAIAYMNGDNKKYLELLIKQLRIEGSLGTFDIVDLKRIDFAIQLIENEKLMNKKGELK